MVAVVAFDEGLGIGVNGGLLYRLPSDMKHFRALTIGKEIVYGRKTLSTFPESKPLPERRNLILTRNPDFSCDGAVICRSAEDVLRQAQNEDALAVIGGESVYQLLKPWITTVYATEIRGVRPADRFFFSLYGWLRTETGEWMEENGVQFRFCTYEK